MLEVVEAWCEQTLFTVIQNDPKAVFEYWKLTKRDNKRNQSLDDKEEDKKIPLALLEDKDDN